MSSYDLSVDLPGTSIDEAIEKVTAALSEQGFGVLTTIDVQATFKKKLDHDFRPYRILGACNPHLARQALEAEPEVGLLLPCNVVVEETDQGARVMIIDPSAMFTVVDNEAVQPVAAEAEKRLKAVREKLAG